jgi:hypothetical protein
MQEAGPVQETAFKPWLFREEVFAVVTWGATLGVGDGGTGGWVALTGWDGLEPEPGTSGVATMDQLDPFHSSARGSPLDWSPTAAQKVVDVHETLSSTLSTDEFRMSGSADGVGAVRSVQSVPFHSETRPDWLEAPA